MKFSDSTLYILHNNVPLVLPVYHQFSFCSRNEFFLPFSNFIFELSSSFQ